MRDLSACLVRRALEIWDQYTRIPKRRPRRWERDPSEESGGAWAREILDEAVATLGERDARPLRRVIAKMDRRFVRTTVPNPSAHPSAPWWCRRDWF